MIILPMCRLLHSRTAVMHVIKREVFEWCVYMCVWVCACVCVNVCVWVCAYVCECVHVMYVCVCVHVHECVVGIKGVYPHPVNLPQFGNCLLGAGLPATALAKPLSYWSCGIREAHWWRIWKRWWVKLNERRRIKCMCVCVCVCACVCECVQVHECVMYVYVCVFCTYCPPVTANYSWNGLIWMWKGNFVLV